MFKTNILLISMLVFLCAGCIENQNIGYFSEINAPGGNNSSLNPENLTVSTPVDSNEPGNTTGSIDINATLHADSVEKYDISLANNAFAFDMYSKMAEGNSQDIFFSPYSIFTALAICYDGAESSTKEQMADVLYFPLNKTILHLNAKETISSINSGSGENELKTANALWVQKDFPVKQQFIGNAGNYYSGKVTNVDFVNQPESSRNMINSWIEDRTNDMITDMISDGDINEDTRLILTNAIYFNGKWKDEFDTDATQARAFYLSDGDVLDAEMMYAKKRFNYAEDPGARILELPYRGSMLCMYIVLPKENDISKFEKSFSLSEYEALKSNLSSGYEVITWLPKFKFESKTELGNSLYEMGMPDAFDGINADFSALSDERLMVSKVIHQASVDVQEKGTEAAAATIGEYVLTSAPAEPEPVMEFWADHPFMFFIEDKGTGCILFMGKVERPFYE